LHGELPVLRARKLSDGSPKPTLGAQDRIIASRHVGRDPGVVAPPDDALGDRSSLGRVTGPDCDGREVQLSGGVCGSGEHGYVGCCSRLFDVARLDRDSGDDVRDIHDAAQQVLVERVPGEPGATASPQPFERGAADEPERGPQVVDSFSAPGLASEPEAFRQVRVAEQVLDQLQPDASFESMLVSGCTCTAQRLHAPLDGSPKYVTSLPWT